MDILAILFPLLAFIIPVFMMFIIYAAVLVLIIWFIISFLNNQKERNRLLADISKQMKQRDSHEPNDSTKAEEAQTEINNQESTITSE